MEDKEEFMIEAALEVEKGTYLPLTIGFKFSKAFATFILEPLTTYCDLLIEDHPLRESDEEIYVWFTAITSRMTEDLCLLRNITYGFWEYSIDEYDRYFKDKKEIYEREKIMGFPRWIADRLSAEEYAKAEQESKNRKFEIMSEEEFVKMCSGIEQKWADIDIVRRTIDDLIRVLDEIHPLETWWYNEEDSLTTFRFISHALSKAIKNDYRKVRIYYT